MLIRHAEIAETVQAVRLTRMSGMLRPIVRMPRRILTH